MPDITIEFTCPGKPSAPHHIFITYNTEISHWVVAVLWYEKRGNLIEMKSDTLFAKAEDLARQLAEDYVRKNMCSDAVFKEAK